MAGCAAKRHARKVSLGEARESTSMGGGRTQGVGKFLQGCGAGDYIACVGDVDNFGVNNEEGRGDTYCAFGQTLYTSVVGQVS